jgi:hypothetical protein
VRVISCKGHKGYFELVLLKDLGELSISEATVEFHGLMVHLGNKTIIIVSVKKNQTWQFFNLDLWQTFHGILVSGH